ncbi:MAG: nucleoside 2-deoxyribosyltransferase [bacterium]|nr:nucleoside 2-deoxyribosyltransferase [bacterium]
MTPTFTVYFAGALFNHKDLTGNALLAAHIEQVSEGRYVCILPQDLEQATKRAVDIRNQDLKQVMTCDLALFNFDGSELDSGTVVEFMFAKFLDIPAVILRSDFRLSGDQGKDGDAWNLMCSFYPRTRIVQVNAIAWYQQAQQEADSLQDATHRLYRRLADAVTENLDRVRQEAALPKDASADPTWLYQWALRFPGSGFERFAAKPSFVAQLVKTKRDKGLI